MRPWRDEEGQTSVFIIGVTVIILLFALTIAAITSVNLQHRKLLSLADSSAQAAATAFFLEDPTQPVLTISDESARQQVQQHLDDIGGAQRLPNLSIQNVQVLGNTTVTVELTATAHPPIVNWLLPAGVTVTAHGAARTELVP